MEVVLSPEKGLVQIWLSRADQDDSAVKRNVDDVCKAAKLDGLFPVVFRSGSAPLERATSDLLVVSRRQMACREVEMER